MSKRKTEEDYYELAEGRGFKWLGDVLPKNTDIPTEWVCSNTHKWLASYHNIRNGSGCPYCAGLVKKVEKDYYNLANKFGFIWIGEKLPKNVMTKTWWECKKGHEWKATYSGIQRGGGCPYCSKKIRKTRNDYHILANKNNFRWLGKSLPKNVKTKTLWEDLSDGRLFRLSYSSILGSSGKPYCSKRLIKNTSDYHKLAEFRKFKWVGKDLPKNAMTKTLWECERGHKWLAKYNDIFCNGSGCPYCAKCAKKVEIDYYSLANKYNFVWIGEKLPKNTNIKTKWLCLKCGHIREVTYSSIQQGKGCPYCKNMINGVLVSKPQIKLNDLLCGSLNYPEGRYHIDVAIMRESQKIAVEYDCWYWHNGNEERDVKRDRLLIFHGWKVLRVKSGRLLPTRKQLKTAINYLLKTNNKIYNLYLEDWK